MKPSRVKADISNLGFKLQQPLNASRGGPKVAKDEASKLRGGNKSRLQGLWGSIFTRKKARDFEGARERGAAIAISQHEEDISQTANPSPEPTITEVDSIKDLDDVLFLASTESLSVSDDGEDDEIVAIAEQEAATYIQAIYRGFRQRYEFQFALLERQLETIQDTKRRQLQKIKQRTQYSKNREKSQLEFQRDQSTRQLQRVTRVVPYLFREAQAQLQNNSQMALKMDHLIALEESHMLLQILAHSYLETLENVNGIWDVLQGQWMGPKKPRPRRVFGPDGKARKVHRERFTQDNDLDPIGFHGERCDSEASSGVENSCWSDKDISEAHVLANPIPSAAMEQAISKVQSILQNSFLN